MSKYKVWVPYVAYKTYEVEAETKDEAIDKVFDENDVAESISLCYQCSEKIEGDFLLDADRIYVEE